MKLLVDTQIFLWIIQGSRRLTSISRAEIKKAAEVYVSAASIWEASIKAGLGRLRVDPAALVHEIGASGFVELPVLARHAMGVAMLAAPSPRSV